MTITKTISFPKMFNYVNNRVNTTQEEESINQCIGILLRTGLRELFGDPNYGSQFHEYLFRLNGGNILEETVKQEIITKLGMYERRITLTRDDIDVMYDGNNSVYINISYIMNSSGEYKDFSIVLSNEEDQ